MSELPAEDDPPPAEPGAPSTEQAGPPPPGPGEKACDACGLPIREAAIKCKHCKRFVDGTREPGHGDSGRIVVAPAPELQPCRGCGKGISPRATRCRYCKAPQVDEPTPATTTSTYKAVALVALIVLGVVALSAPLVARAGRLVLALTLDQRAADALQQQKVGTAARVYEEAAQTWLQAGFADEAARSYQARAEALSPDTNPMSDWASVVDAYQRSAACFDQAGFPHEAAQARGWQADALTRLETVAGERQAAALYAQVALEFQAIEDLGSAAQALANQAWCLRPGEERAPHQSWAESRRLYAEAARLAELAEEHRAAGDYLQSQASVAQPNNDPDGGDWSRAAALYGEASLSFAKARQVDEQAGALWDQAWCLEQQEPADEATAGQLYAQAAELYRQLGDARSQAGALAAQAYCLWPGDPIQPHQSWSEAATVYGQALELYRQDPEGGREVLSCLTSQASCLRPDNDPQASDWTRPAELYARATAQARQLEDTWSVARCLLDQVQCQREGRLEGPSTPEQEGLLEQALEALGGDDPELRAELEAWRAGRAE